MIPKDPAKMREYISFSEWMLWRKCQQRWKLDYLDGRRHKIYGVHLDFGTAIHEAIELSRSRKPKLTKEEAIPHFEKAFTKLFTDNKDKYKEKERTSDPEYFLSAGRNILEHFEECEELASAEVVYNEHELFVPLDRTDDVKMNFKGFIDMVIKTKDKRNNTVLYICDFKSCSWGWPLEKKTDKELQFQLLLYKHFIAKKFDLNPKEIRTAFVLLKKRPRKNDSPVEFFPVSAGPVSVQRALDAMNSDISEMKDAVENDSYKKNRDFCVSDYGDTCPYLNSTLCPSGK